MGQQNTKLRILTLNYSAILLSPFEFYAVDNWQQLQKIGIIFQENLKNDFDNIKREVQDINIADAPKEEYYIRKTFDWRIDKIDKEVKTRYSPLYIERTDRDYLDRVLYPGITEDFTFMDKRAFYQKWQREYNYKEINFPETVRHMCKRFDFQCYRAFVQYLFNREENLEQVELATSKQREEMENNMLISFQEIIESINRMSQERRRDLIQIYREFMRSYFERIDLPIKMDKTRRYLFEKNQLDVINLQEANGQILNEIRKQEKYYAFAPMDSEENADQCLVLVKKNSILVPEYFREKYPEEEESVVKVKDALLRAIESYQSFGAQKELFTGIIQDHFNPRSIEDILDILAKPPSQADFPVYRKKLKESVYSSLQNPLKSEFQEWTQHYQQRFVAYWRALSSKLQPKQRAVIEPVLNDIQKKGLLHWSEGFTFVTFCFTNKKLQPIQQTDKSPLILASFHLSSKQIKNRVQIQILGLLIYEVIRHNCKIIFSGDFNSHVVVHQKESEEGIFTFLKHFYAGSEFDLKNIDRLQTDDGLYVFPKHPMIFTTKKKRTILQVQAKKSNKLATKCIDQIISNIPIIYNECYSGEIAYLGSQENHNKNFIPHKDHPYDHFAVQAILDIAGMKQQ